MKPSRVTLKIRLGSRAHETTSSPLIWRWDIGHYGGYFVDVPAQNIHTFKSRFPKAAFPRKQQEKSVWETMTDTAAMKFESLWPESRGRYYQIYFADRSLGESILANSDMLQKETAEKPSYND